MVVRSGAILGKLVVKPVVKLVQIYLNQCFLVAA